jgi:hypothetical protein
METLNKLKIEKQVELNSWIMVFNRSPVFALRQATPLIEAAALISVIDRVLERLETDTLAEIVRSLADENRRYCLHTPRSTDPMEGLYHAAMAAAREIIIEELSA